MKKTVTLSIIIIVSMLFQRIVFFPWWVFLVPVFLLGALLPLGKWKVHSFLFGFLAGFLVWTLSTFFFEVSYKGEITTVLGKMISVPYYILYLIIGFIGGILTGLSFYSGFLLRSGREVLSLEL
jgi:hypothetical protein